MTNIKDKENKESKGNSPHILNTSANLLGLCFIVLTSRTMLHLSATSFIDILTALAIIIFMLSCLLSFLSMRSTTVRGIRFERIADTVFLVGLFLLFSITMLITFDIIK